MLLVSFGFGVVNSVSTDKTGVISCMVTGHLQRIATSAVELSTTGLSDAQKRGALTSVQIVLAFMTGVICTARVVLNDAVRSPVPFPTFSILAVAYSLLFVLHDKFHARRPRLGLFTKAGSLLIVIHKQILRPQARPLPRAARAPSRGRELGCSLDPYWTSCQ